MRTRAVVQPAAGPAGVRERVRRSDRCPRHGSAPRSRSQRVQRLGTGGQLGGPLPPRRDRIGLVQAHRRADRRPTAARCPARRRPAGPARVRRRDDGPPHLAAEDGLAAWPSPRPSGTPPPSAGSTPSNRCGSGSPARRIRQTPVGGPALDRDRSSTAGCRDSVSDAWRGSAGPSAPARRTTRPRPTRHRPGTPVRRRPGRSRACAMSACEHDALAGLDVDADPHDEVGVAGEDDHCRSCRQPRHRTTSCGACSLS